MSVVRLNHLDQSFVFYDSVWGLVNSIITTAPSSEVRLLVTRSSAASEHIYYALKFYSYTNEFLIHLEPFLDERERVEIVITKNDKVFSR